MRTAAALAERGLIPEPAIRLGIRSIVRRRLREQSAHGMPMDRWARQMAESPIALATGAANAQHYEVPADFFRLVLGPHLKYSSAYWPDTARTLGQAEQAMLELTVARADLADGQRILELGCGWGSLSLFMARRFPRARILAVSNSHQQRAWIEARARERGLDHLTVQTADMNTFDPPARFDRVVSVEMFEHMRNWQALLARIHRRLEPGGALFVHVFAHVRHAYPFETTGSDDWMGRHFFTGGMMPADNLLPSIAAPFGVEGHWRVDGTHYARTAEAWHDNLLRARREVIEVLRGAMGQGGAPAGRAEATRQFHRWRLFFLACAELFGYHHGTEWLVSHYRLRKDAASS
jgi:cyclopropane-fatty-acyl-phospholipid synthase